MGHYSLIILKRNSLFIWVLGNASISSTIWVLPYRGLVEDHPGVTLENKRSLKKTQGMDKRLQYRGLGRRRGSLPESYQPYSYMGSQRGTTSYPFCSYSRKGWFLWSSQSKNWPTPNPKGIYLQCRNLPKLSLLSTQLYFPSYPSNLGPGQLSQSHRLKALLRQIQRSSQTHLLATIFTRAQSHREGLEDYTPKSDTQPLLSQRRSPRRISCKSVCPMESC